MKMTGTALCLLTLALSACADGPPGTGVTATGMTTLLGTWIAGDRAGQARYGRFVITDSRIEWSGSTVNPGCSTGYRLLSRLDMQGYPDSLPGLDQPAAARRHQVFRLALQNRRCTAGRSELQFAIAAEAPDRAELITYGRDLQPRSWGHVLRPAR